MQAYTFPAPAKGEVHPIIAIDSREIQPLNFTHLRSVVSTLVTADYTLFGNEWSAAIERKGSLDELVTCCSVERDRFSRELMRMRSHAFRRLILVGFSRADIELGRFRSRMAPRAVLATLSAFEIRYDVAVYYFPTPEAAALQVESWLWWIAREIDKNANNLRRSQDQVELQTEKE
jgi:DNA excision repair protein ERCC-4